MARTKKTEQAPLTLEQIPAIPVEEQPYPLPKGWKWVRLGEAYQINPKNDVDDTTPVSFVPMEKIDPGMKGSFTFDVITWAKAKKGHTHFANGDVAFAKISPCFENGKSMLVHGLKNGIGAGTTELIILRQQNISQKFTFYIISSDNFIKKGTSTYSGTVGQQRISIDFVRKYPIPLPPIDEQQRIVDRIESLFAKLDEAREKVESVIESFEKRKAAIIYNAIIGDITNKWRKNNKLYTTHWNIKTINELCTSLKYGTSKKSYKNGSVIVLRMGNLKHGEIDWSDLSFTNDNDDIKNYSLEKGDVLFNRTNSPDLVGKTSIYRGEFPAIYAGYLIKLNYKKDEILGDFLNYTMNSVFAKKYCQSVKSDGVNQSNISAKKIGEFSISVPSLPEQQEIVRILDELLAREEHIKETAEKTLERIDLMKKAILARAFRGELGTNVRPDNNQ